MRFTKLAVLLFLVVPGCALDDTGSGASAVYYNEDGYACAKIEDSAIGQEGLVLEAGNVVVRFHSWAEKGGEPGEYIGFAYERLSGHPDLTVKAGTERFRVKGTAWSNPNGSEGPDAKGISHVEVCECDDPHGDDGNDSGDDGDATDDGGDDQCDDIEGCGEPPPYVE